MADSVSHFMLYDFHAKGVDCIVFLQLAKAFRGDKTELNGLLPHFVESFPQFSCQLNG